VQDGGGGGDPVPVSSETRDARARVDAVPRLPRHPLPTTPGVRRTCTWTFRTNFNTWICVLLFEL